MSELREQVRLQVSTVYAWGRIEEAGTLLSPPTIIADTTDRILEIVREAMLSGEVVEAGAGGYQDLLKEWGGEMGAIGADDIGLGVFDVVMGEVGGDDNAYELANAALTAALDAMIGKESNNDRG